MDINYDVISDTLSINGEVLLPKKYFPPSSESSTDFRSNPHYVKVRGKTNPESLMCVYHYTREAWLILGTTIVVRNVEYWY